MKNIIVPNGLWNNKRPVVVYAYSKKLHFNTNFMASYTTKLPVVLFIAL